eukprot:2514081-Rhodomonas_salina.1
MLTVKPSLHDAGTPTCFFKPSHIVLSCGNRSLGSGDPDANDNDRMAARYDAMVAHDKPRLFKC